MSDAKTGAADSSRAVVLTAASLIAAIMIERLVGRLGELGRWVLSPLDLLVPIAVGTVALLTIENLSPDVTTEFLALGAIGFLGGILVSRTVVAGMKRGAPLGASPFDSYPARTIDLLFVGTAVTLSTACLLRLTTTPHPAVLNSLILLAAAQDAAIVVLQLRWWSRVTRTA
jgi:hypothetical protein